MRIFKYRNTREYKKAARLPLSAYLSYLLVATMVFTGVSFSKFATTASGSDSARVARFSVSAAPASGQAQALSLDLNSATGITSDHYAFTVASDSEVMVAYTVTVDLKTQLPTGVTMTLTLADTGSVEMTKVSDTVYTYSSELVFQDSHNYTLTFTGDPETVTAATTLTGITVTVTAEQMD